MTIDLSAVPTLTDTLGLYDIPLNRDTFPYAQLQAQGRYPDRSTPNTLPEFLATLNATRKSDFTPDMPSTDGDRNLNVRLAASDVPSGGGGVGTAAYDGYYGASGVTGWSGGTGASSGIWYGRLGYLTGITLSLIVTAGGSAGTLGEVLVALKDDHNDVFVNVFGWTVSLGPTVYGNGAFSTYVPFLPTLDIVATFPAMTSEILLAVGATNCSGQLRYMPIGYV